MSTHGQLRRTDLFLVRVWIKDAEAVREVGGRGDGDSKPEWCGKVQRVVNGESRQFSSLQDLIDALLTMLSDNEGR